MFKKMSGKVSAVAVLTLVALSLSVVSFAGAAEQRYAWKLAHEEGIGELQDLYANKFKEVIEKSGGGRVSVSIYPVGQLGDGTNLVELLQMGGVEFAINNPGAVAPIVPACNVFSLHFLLPNNTVKLNKILHEGEGIKYLNELYLKQDMSVIDWMPTGLNTWTANKPLRTPADFKGVKFRTMAAPVIAKSYNAYGADAVPIPYTELYSALQLHMVDGQVNPVYAINNMKYYEVQSHLMLSYPDCFVATFCANRDYWETLPEDIKRLVAEAANEANVYIIENQVRISDEGIQYMKDRGTIVIELTDDERGAFKAIAEQNRNIYTDLAGDKGQKLLDLLAADAEKLN